VNENHSCPLTHCAVYNSPRIVQAGSFDEDTNSTAPNPKAMSLVGNVGVSPLPGSERVYDRSTRNVRKCTNASNLCPLATEELVATYSSILAASNATAGGTKARGEDGRGDGNATEASDSSGRSSSSDSSNSSRGDFNGTNSSWAQQVAPKRSHSLPGSDVKQHRVWVNRAPLSLHMAGITTMCNPTLNDLGQFTLGAFWGLNL
jgi:hypothetical protein